MVNSRPGGWFESAADITYKPRIGSAPVLRTASRGRRRRLPDRLTRSVKGAVLCGETAALALGVPTLKAPLWVELATTLPGRSGTRRSPLLVLGEDRVAKEAREKRSYPLRYCLKAATEPELHGEFRCTGLMRTAVDVMMSYNLSQALVVADGVARRLQADRVLAADASLIDVSAVADLIAAHPFAAARRRAELVAGLASPLAESVGESYSRAAFELLGFEQPVLQHVFNDRNGFIGWTDFWWPKQGDVGNSMAQGKYVDASVRGAITAEEAVYREKLREDRIRGLGHGFVRWGWADVESPDRLRHKLVAAGLGPRNRT